MVGKI